MTLSYKNQSLDLQNKSIDWFLYDRDLGHERVNCNPEIRELAILLFDITKVNF